jgi:hypothetical protein
MKHVHSGRIERWLGKERIEQLSASTRGWYGRPIPLLDVPGSVKITRDGDFVGTFERGGFASAADALWDVYKLACRAPHGQLNAGFASVSDALNRASSGFGQQRSFYKAGPTGVVGISSSLFRLGSQPVGGTAPAAAGGGTVYDSSSAGALAFANPAAGTNRLTGADVMASVAGNSLLLYDLLFGVAKTMNSTANEAVTGVPNRYTSTDAAAEDYCGDNFLFIQVGGTALAATAHNWVTGGTGNGGCTYTNQANASANLPQVTGVSGAIVDRMDWTLPSWFAPLASGDNGVKALTKMECSAAVATGVIWFMIGHPVGVMALPVANLLTPFDWITNRKQAPRVFNNACLQFLEIAKPSTTATNYGGLIYTCSTSS